MDAKWPPDQIVWAISYDSLQERRWSATLTAVRTAQFVPMSSNALNQIYIIGIVGEGSGGLMHLSGIGKGRH